MEKSHNYSEEFDRLVEEYNKWLSFIDDPKFLRGIKMRSFLNGIGSIFGSFSEDKSVSPNVNPLYSRDDLSFEQQYVIAFASDWRRVGKRLDAIIFDEISDNSLSVEDAKFGKHLVEQVYNQFKDYYVTQKIISSSDSE